MAVPRVWGDSVGLAEAKDNLSALTARANATGRPFTILKNNKPWVEVRPIADPREDEPIRITPLARGVRVADLDELFVEYDGEFRPTEDGFSRPVGEEAM